MKIRIELSDIDEPEVLIRCPRLTPEITAVSEMLNSNNPHAEKQISAFLGGTEYFIPASDILFFETDGARSVVHTREKMYYSPLRISELSEILPRNFVRSSKSCLVNIDLISEITKSLTGPSRACFYDSDKIIYISRMYYKQLRDQIEEKRL